MSIDFQQWLQIQQRYVEYAAVLDVGQFDRWPDFFTDDCVYKIQPRENHERGFPLATLSLTSNGMLLDRVYGIQETLYHDPYYQRHIVSTPIIRQAQAECVSAEANYAVFRTKYDQLSTVFNVGRYIDEWVRAPQGWLLSQRLCIYDSEMIPNSLIYPL
ncbi:MAG: aromatic-ring-hydroxylating dioxygenase subunit beta [Alphaproteobacteria bacterium]|nr:aromatic-ring-hydroxylating dioxygenase subunit beta [Alphaproteobacteria bacterium]